MRRHVLVLTTVLLLAFAACGGGSGGGVEPGDGPAATSEPTEPEPTTVVGDGEPTGEPDGEPSEEVERDDAVVKFGQKYVYTDGVEVEVTKVRHGRISDEDFKDWYEDEATPYWVKVTIRVRNGSKSKVEIIDSSDVTYGPDGEQVSTYSEKGSLDGPLLPGRAKSATVRLHIPKKYQGDVVWVQTIDFDREQVIFSGSLRDDLN